MILLTGGAGYIGSHMGVALAAAGLPYVVFDNFSNSQPGVLHRMKMLGQGSGGIGPVLVGGDIRDASALDAVFARYPITAVVHFAGLKSVAESMANPALYYEVNLAGSINLVRAMQRAGVKQLVFSSSATVYGDPAYSPVPETAALAPANTYGWSKLLVEQVLRDVAAADPAWAVACLRYFNPVGAHPSGQMGEDPAGVPNNLMPFIAQVASGRRSHLSIFGNDYATDDGTGVRDYIHVMDLVEGHLAALQYLQAGKQAYEGAGPTGGVAGEAKPADRSNCIMVNLGTGQGISVLQMVEAFVQHTGQAVPYTIMPRRPGDVARYFGDATLAQTLLGWRATRGLQAMCEDTWRWQSGNPKGYAG